MVGVAAIWLACGMDGERETTGTCPAGEVCDPTVSGLTFFGEQPSDRFLANQPGVIASGGVQHITFRSGSIGAIPTDATVAVDEPAIVALEGSTSASADVRGVSEGSARLRVVNAQGELIDRTTLSVASIDRVRLLGYSMAETLDETPAAEWAFFAGGRVYAVFALESATGVRLVDSSAEITEGSSVDAIAWDAAWLDVPAADEVTLGIHAGGRSFDASADVVDAIDSLSLSSFTGTGDDLHVGIATSPLSLCVLPRDAQGRAVAGVAFQVEVDGPLQVDEGLNGEASDPASPFDYGCFRVVGNAAGEGTVTIRGGGADKTFAITVDAA